MADSGIAVLKAVEARLKAVAAVTDLVGTRIYGTAPAKPRYPFILISTQAEPFAAATFSGMTHTLRVQAFAEEQKPGMVLAIRAAVLDALDRQEEALNILGLVMCQFDGVADAFPQDDGRTYQSVVEFNVTVA